MLVSTILGDTPSVPTGEPAALGGAALPGGHSPNGSIRSCSPRPEQRTPSPLPSSPCVPSRRITSESILRTRSASRTSRTDSFFKVRGHFSLNESAVGSEKSEKSERAGSFMGHLPSVKSLSPPFAMPERRTSGASSARGLGECESISSIPTTKSKGTRTMLQRSPTSLPPYREEISFCGFRSNGFLAKRLLRFVNATKPYCKLAMKSKPYQILMLTNLMIALFLPDAWVILDRPSGFYLDIILMLVMILFLVELAVQSIAVTRTYLWSSFFWMDVLGTASVLLDISYLQGSSIVSSSSGSNHVILRLSRVAKLAARAGRFSKIVKLLRFLPGMGQTKDQGTAKNMSHKLVNALSMRISCLIIVMVIVMPMITNFRHPEQDWSLQSWLQILEAELVSNHESFRAQLAMFTRAYDDKVYFPYSLRPQPGFVMPGSLAGLSLDMFSGAPPANPRNVVRVEGAHLICDLNFTRPNQIDAWMNTGVQLFIIFLIVINALLLTTFVSGVVLRPLEVLMVQVQRMTSTICKSVSEITHTMKSLGESQGRIEELDEDDIDDRARSETEMLEVVLQKLAVLSNIAMQKSIVDAEVLEGLSEGEKAVLHGYSNVFASRRPMEEDLLDSQSYDDSDGVDSGATLRAQKAIVEEAGLSLDLIDSFNLNPLELDRARNHAASMYFLGKQSHGVLVEAVTMQHFLEDAENSYNREVPYHNWYHAVDVAHCVYRLLQICRAEVYLNNSERYGLLVSAIAHDLGHIGLNNIFLTETAHELALRYNDKSPLENMHCAKLFELVSNTRCDIFENMSRQQYKDVRKVCIEAILHTDNAHHFSMVREVQMLCEVNSEMFSGKRNSSWPSGDTVETLRQPDNLKLLLSLFLHFSDISNPMKPFRVCRIWAAKITEEFFQQGDMEKSLGIPIQFQNDREKVDRSMSQIGFIEFLVTPLAHVSIKLLPPIEPYCQEMVANATTWHQYWLSETQPPPAEAEKKAVAERIAKLQRKFGALEEA